MPEKITHEGIVTEIRGNEVCVRIQSTSACGSCHAKSMCSMSEKADKDIRIKTENASLFAIGEKVEVSLTSGMGLKAVLYAYVFSLLAGAAAFTIAAVLTPKQGIWGLAALAAIALYFLLLKRLAPKINNQFRFCLSKIDSGLPPGSLSDTESVE